MSPTDRSDSGGDRVAAAGTRPLTLVLGAALAIRAAMFVAYHRSPLTGQYALDTQYYRTWAVRIASGDAFEAGVFEQSPLYAHLLAAVFRLFGPSEPAAIVLQMLCGALTAVLLYDAARRLFGGRAALVTGLLAAAYGPLLLHECLLMKSFLEPLCVAAALWAALRFGEERRLRWAAAAGMAIGWAVQVREVHAILVLPAGLALLGPRQDCGRRRRLTGLAALLLAFTATLFPVAARNWSRSGEFAPVTAAGGENLYLAHGPEANEFYTNLPFVSGVPHREHEDFREEAMLRAGRPLSRGEASRFWYREAARAVLADPARAVRLTLRKMSLLVRDYEVPDSEDYSVAREHLPVLRPLPTFGWVFGLGLLGLTALVPARRSRAPLAWFLAVLALEVVLTFNLARYRLAMAALWLIPAGAGAAWLLDRPFERGRGGRRVAAAALVAAATFFSHLPPPASFPARQLAADERSRLAHAARRARALPEARAAAAAEPWNPGRRVLLGTLLRNLGLIPESMAVYERILRDQPEHFEARWELASSLVEEGRLPEAVEHLRILARISPGNVAVHYFLGRFLLRSAAGRGASTALLDEEEALAHLRQALRLDPGHAPSLYEIGRLLHLRGDAAGAVDALSRALRAVPGFGDAAHLLGIIHARGAAAPAGGLTDPRGSPGPGVPPRNPA